MLVPTLNKRNQAKCDSGAYRSVKSFERDVERQCAHFVRKHEVGRKLSKAMLKRVLAQFIESDLAACRAAIAREERRVNFWRKVTLAGCGMLGKLCERFGWRGEAGGVLCLCIIRASLSHI